MCYYVSERRLYVMYGKRLRELRIKDGLSQAEFAKQFDTAPSTISTYETETREPSLDFLQAVIKKYNVSYDWLFGETAKTDYRSFFISDDFDDFADYIATGYTPEEAEKMLATSIERYGKMILRLHYDDRRKVEQYVKELREQGEYD